WTRLCRRREWRGPRQPQRLTFHFLVTRSRDDCEGLSICSSGQRAIVSAWHARNPLLFSFRISHSASSESDIRLPSGNLSIRRVDDRHYCIYADLHHVSLFHWN